MWIKKLIPGKITIKSLYWVEYEKKMQRELENIFDCIDKDEYREARFLIKLFEENFSQNGVPNWVGESYAEIFRAKSMLVGIES